jgi:hypothetical protein
MIETLRRYWIGLLVLVMIGTHAGIVGMIRIQASQAKESLSCEIDLGSFYVGRDADLGVVHLRIHSIVPVNHRMQSRQLFELNLHQVRQAVEEYCRQADPNLLEDPLLTDLKENLMDTLVRTVGETAIEDVVLTEVRPIKDQSSLAFSSATGEVKSAGKMVITRKAKDQERHAEHEAAKEEGHGEGAHGDAHGDAHGGGHDKKAAGGHDKKAAGGHDKKASGGHDKKAAGGH